MGNMVAKIERLEKAIGKNCSSHQMMTAHIVLFVQEMVRDIAFDEDFLDWSPEDIVELIANLKPYHDGGAQ